jgi:hypothetical protein
MRRVHLYVDGFNFYYAVLERHRKQEFPIGLAWCDFRKLGEQFMLAPGERVEAIRYFSAPVTRNLANRAGEERRQSVWMAAVETIPRLTAVWGFHQRHGAKLREEKQTDINIAVEILLDAAHRACDRAVLISGDIDLVPAVRAARERLPRGQRLEVDVWVPPGSKHQQWSAEAADLGMRCTEITPEMLAASRLPDVIHTESGTSIKCLPEWQMPTGLAGLRWSNVGG